MFFLVTGALQVLRKIKSEETYVDKDFYDNHQSMLLIITNNYNVTTQIKVTVMDHFSSNPFGLCSFKNGLVKHLLVCVSFEFSCCIW